MKIGFVSLGCSKNLVDTEVMLHRLLSAGYEITPDETEADVVIINTCGFIGDAKEESIDNILDIAWLKEHKNLRAIIATGCMVERYREEVMRELPEVDALLGVGSLDKIVEAVEAVLAGEKYTHFGDKNTAPIGGDRILTTPDHTAYIKIAEGCDNCCTYCAIPAIRGRFRSRPIEEIVEEARGLSELGVKEICLVAQDTTRYGLDLYGKYSLAELVRAISEGTDIPWIRLLYCYPDKITDELLLELRDNPRLLPYMDIPVQHISDRVLSAMNRHGDGKTIRAAITRLREAVPDITLRTTVIVGFPGETEEEFSELCEFVKWARFDRVGAFCYSPEEDTPAALFPDQIGEQEKQDRYDTVMATQLRIAEEKNAERIGRTVTVLCEGYDPVAEAHYGRTAADAPEVDGKIYFFAKHRLAVGEFYTVKIEEAVDYDLVGRVVKEKK